MASYKAIKGLLGPFLLSKSRRLFLKAVKKVTVSGLVMALYVTIMFLTQGFAFGQFQIRIATSIYALAAIHPFLIIPLGLANLLSNVLMGGLGIMDMIGGLFVGILTSTLIYQVKKNQWGARVL